MLHTTTVTAAQLDKLNNKDRDVNPFAVVTWNRVALVASVLIPGWVQPATFGKDGTPKDAMARLLDRFDLEVVKQDGRSVAQPR